VRHFHHFPPKGNYSQVLFMAVILKVCSPDHQPRNTQECARNANLQTTPKRTESETLGVRSGNPGNSEAPWSVKTTGFHQSESIAHQNNLNKNFQTVFIVCAEGLI
jgi:hypothetical protein